ncbi:MAG: hypothetical protein J07HQW1_01645 [Haloquadratum walsbyi J07HQW1]|jgi:hypothetical protein|uniref:Uncharacterized protein n=1 Tax=Haloquadratum walsbyi J07HQW1 TaxID=1238424 RepID=U1PHG3_9EURY|nr:MAG: hypothetical protein J07HQW1_01645 [Haloquadratum walsbyi J07HQW1]
MIHQLSPAEQAAALVSNPDLYDSLADEYETELEFYSTLRNNAQKSLETFEEYVRLRGIFLTRGPTEAIRSRIEDRLDRSLKNMVLGTSPRGRAYAVDTLSELEARRQTFQRLTIEIPSLLAVVQTTIEHLYDDVSSPTDVRQTCESLLAATPANQRDAIEYLSRVRLTEQLLASESPQADINTAVLQYLENVSLPRVDTEMTAAEYRQAAEERSPTDPDKQRLYEAALHADPSSARVSDYLYFTASNLIEDYRHGGDDITRAELIVARRQLQAVDRLHPESWDQTKQAYAESYRHIADAIEAGGGRWLSTHASNLPPEWWSVAEAYVRAAQAIDAVDMVRAIKYLSKSVRHAGHATDDWKTRKHLHRTAWATFDQFDPTVVAENPEQLRSAEEIETAITGTRSVHQCREFEASAHVAFEAGNYNTVHTASNRARSAAEQSPQEYIHLRELDAIETIATARQAEQRGEYETALKQYQQFDSEESHLQSGVTCHAQLCEIKQAVNDGRHNDALRIAHQGFNSESIIAIATEASCGVLRTELNDSSDLTATEQFLSINTDVVSTLSVVLRLLQAGGTATQLLQQQAAACFQNL